MSGFKYIYRQKCRVLSIFTDKNVVSYVCNESFPVVPAQSEVSEKVRRILREQFDLSLQEKDEEIDTIEERLVRVRKALHLVRYGTVCQYYAGTVIKVRTLSDMRNYKDRHPLIHFCYF